VFEDRGLISIDGLQRPLHYCALTAVRAGAAMRSSAPLPGAAPCGLSTRELEVLRLMAVGKTNLEIAEMLFISHSTVTSHVRSIFNKTGVANRAEAASFAYRHRLVGADDLLA
jgi:DNA-binding NarL/FixJ family response regulator